MACNTQLKKKSTPPSNSRSSSLSITSLSAGGLSNEHLSQALDSKIICPNRLVISSSSSSSSDDSLASVAVGFPDLLSSDIHTWPRPPVEASLKNKALNAIHVENRPTSMLPDDAQVGHVTDVDRRSNVVVLPHNRCVIVLAF